MHEIAGLAFASQEEQGKGARARMGADYGVNVVNQVFCDAKFFGYKALEILDIFNTVAV